MIHGKVSDGKGVNRLNKTQHRPSPETKLYELLIYNLSALGFKGLDKTFHQSSLIIFFYCHL